MIPLEVRRSRRSGVSTGCGRGRRRCGPLASGSPWPTTPTAAASSASCTRASQQHLVALAVNLQLARRLVDSDPSAAKALLEEMGRGRGTCAGRGGEARTAHLPAAARGGRAGAAIRVGGGERGRSRPLEVAADAATRPRSREPSTSAASRCSSAPAPARERRSRARRAAARSSSRSSGQPARRSRSDGGRGCAIASRRSAAG